jgi:hypothetical protein
LLLIPVSGIAWNVLIPLLIIFFFANWKWWKFMKEEEGVLFSIKALYLNYLLGIDIIVALLYGLMIYPFSEKN